MTFDVTPVFHKGIQGNLEGEASSLSEVTSGFLQATFHLVEQVIAVTKFH